MIWVADDDGGGRAIKVHQFRFIGRQLYGRVGVSLVVVDNSAFLRCCSRKDIQRWLTAIFLRKGRDIDT